MPRYPSKKNNPIPSNLAEYEPAWGTSHYYAISLTLPAYRTWVLAVFALHRELEKICHTVQEVQLAQIKLAWWQTEVNTLHEAMTQKDFARHAFTLRNTHPVLRTLCAETGDVQTIRLLIAVITSYQNRLQHIALLGLDRTDFPRLLYRNAAYTKEYEADNHENAYSGLALACLGVTGFACLPVAELSLIEQFIVQTRLLRAWINAGSMQQYQARQLLPTIDTTHEALQKGLPKQALQIRLLLGQIKKHTKPAWILAKIHLRIAKSLLDRPLSSIVQKNQSFPDIHHAASHKTYGHLAFWQKLLALTR